MKKLKLIFAILGLVVVCLVLLVSGVLFWWTNIYIPRARQNAEACWTTIGRPMRQLEKRLKCVEENSSLQALTRELEPFGIHSFYKARKGERNPNSINIPREITEVLDGANVRADDHVALAAPEFDFRKQHEADLIRLYQGILRREPAVWNFVPEDGMTLRVPSYLAARGISQLICVDALHKLERGDEKGATDAIVAGLKMTSNFEEQPILISQMIRVAIEALFAQVIARLPEDPEGLRQLVNDVETKRERWRTAVQTETWAIMRVADYLGLKPKDFRTFYGNKSPIGKIQLSLTQSIVEADCAVFVSGVADQVRISEQITDSALSDLGVNEMRTISLRHAPVLTATPRFASFSDVFRETWYRSWIRLNASLLLREQAELIRSARAQVRAGKSGNLGERESVVVPGAKWQLTRNSDNVSISLKLTPVPSWTADNDIIGKTFFLLPLDGSGSWKFRLRQVEYVAYN